MICFINSPFDAKIKINDNFFNIKKDELFPVPNLTDKITVFAGHTNYAYFLPYILEEKDCVTYNYLTLNAKVVEIKNNLFLKEKQTINLTKTQNLLVTFYNSGKSFLEIKVNGKNFSKQFLELCHSPKIFENENFVVVYAKNYTEGFSVEIFDKNKNEFCYSKIVNNILIENNNLNLLLMPTPIGTAENQTYNLNSKNLDLINKFFVEVNKNTTFENYKGLTLFYAVKSGYYSLAKTLLSQNMQQIATNEMLNAYFKEYNKIIKSPFTDTPECYLIFSKNTISDVNFTLNNQMLIDNISKK